MKSFAPVLPLLIPVLLIAAEGPVPPVKTSKVMLRVSIYEGDPLGSREAKTLTVLAEPNIVVAENQEFSFLSGGEIPVPSDGSPKRSFAVGVRAWGAVGTVQNGRVGIDLTAEVKNARQQLNDRISVQIASGQVVGMFKLGERVVIPFDNGNCTRRTWAEVVVEQADL